MELFNELVAANKLQSVIIWVSHQHIEILATILGLIYLIYSVQGDKRLWYYGLVTSGLYVYVCYKAGIYADMGINFYYVLVSVYGLILWSGKTPNNKEELPISKTSKKEFVYISVSNLLLFIIIAFILKKYTDSSIPYWDSFTTSSSIVATYMLARKKIEHWLIWIVVDAISVGLYIYKGLYPTTVLFGVYTVLAVIGYLEWKKKCQVQIQKL